MNFRTYLTSAALLASNAFAQQIVIPEFAPDEVIVQFKSDVADEHIANAFRVGRLNLIKHVRTSAMEEHGEIGLTHVTTGLPVVEAVNALNHSPGVAFAEPNWIYHNLADANDPSYLDGSLWGMFSDDY